MSQCGFAAVIFKLQNAYNFKITSVSLCNLQKCRVLWKKYVTYVGTYLPIKNKIQITSLVLTRLIDSYHFQFF